MPTYDYRCTQCSHEFSEFHGINQDKPQCTQCDSEVSKIFKSGPSFKGSGEGWYGQSNKERK